jgi:hypothetical protein
VRAGALIQDRSLSTGGPTSPNERCHQQATFIYEDQKCFQV